MNPALALLWVLTAARCSAPALPSAALAQDPRATPIPAAGAERPASLLELRANPGRWLGESVRVAFQFRSRVEDWNPYLSRFGPLDWIAFEAWPDDVFTWDPQVFANPAPRLFVRRETHTAGVLARARRYARFEARAIVREAFLGEPWLEVVELEPLPGEVGEGAILHVGRARQCALERQWELALEQYERAKSAPLPPQALAAVEKEILETREARELDERENPPEEERPPADEPPMPIRPPTPESRP